MEKPAAIIKAISLTKAYGALKAVNDVNFEIQPGTCFGFLGPNGAGKTTVMRMIYCVTPLTSGLLTVNGENVMENMSAVKRGIGVVTQDDSLDYDLNVINNLLVYARYYDLTRDQAVRRANELIEFFQLEEKRNENVRTLSGGMKRRLQIARALINKPSILILDEPSTGLDPQARHHVWAKCHELIEQGVTLLLTTHYMDEAEQLCDQIAVMDRGKIITEASPWDLIKSEVSPYVVEIRGEEKARQKILAAVSDRIDFHEALSDRLLLYTPDATPLHTHIQDMNIPVKTLLSRRSSLEDVFLKLTGRELID
ncbi:MAG: ATP-binding cassette domain-containing protein [Candidatus Marinimicrobia bacterium]|jgi:lipooligosaccharide transport system ATP-binding protein|nr:ATP-binding cassette domain-containing protein [Candidatus Neomarinimicrobiota bacterium]MBT3574441.1 ATP-binding cassette domain-containing protein [Candidatus Neomarinimicrobiota bacterium]MBT3680944.1 ATP-binding cassette domain-containing protein [Candidatus Neomarinimicrobiota bacterium]MBT3952171.1 ATP-binding cassette domain-containing protein [Candidatus Neomarinimicrobiota bacterium]MBT4253685.1 ATP-binding cassette domain-containing protein [Candidatus Neomarinimicrobiota bacterium